LTVERGENGSMPTASRKKAGPVKRRDRIVATPGICGGQPRIAGTRIPVAVLLRCRALGYSDERVLEGYPTLKKADLTAAWKYAQAVNGRS
jgi:uncharacterized protein (DUF433 family)